MLDHEQHCKQRANTLSTHVHIIVLMTIALPLVVKFTKKIDLSIATTNINEGKYINHDINNSINDISITNIIIKVIIRRRGINKISSIVGFMVRVESSGNVW